MKITETSLPGVQLINSPVYKDNRGAFFESFNLRKMTEAGLPAEWAQDNFSQSKQNVIRGIHYQIVQPQGKLVWAAHGAVLDVAVDLRKSSPQFGSHVAVELTAGSGDMLWIPPGFGHGFLVLSETAGFCYKVTDYYSPAGERTVLWNDADLAIPWPVRPEDVIVSEKDAQGKRLSEAEVYP